MPNGHAILELADLPAMHPPCGIGFRHAYGPPAVIRMSIDPTPLPAGIMHRQVEVDWMAHPGNAAVQNVSRDIGWTNLQAHITNLNTLLVQLPITVNEKELTAQAALGVMALLISDLEHLVLQTVLQIGSGGDYLVQYQNAGNPTQVEGSGIRQAATASVSLTRLNQKKAQVVKQSNDGYASVTTFAYPAGATKGTVVHSYLHYVVKTATATGRKGTRGPNNGKRK